MKSPRSGWGRLSTCGRLAIGLRGCAPGYGTGDTVFFKAGGCSAAACTQAGGKEGRLIDACSRIYAEFRQRFCGSETSRCGRPFGQGRVGREDNRGNRTEENDADSGGRHAGNRPTQDLGAEAGEAIRHFDRTFDAASAPDGTRYRDHGQRQSQIAIRRQTSCRLSEQCAKCVRLVHGTKM